MQMKVREFHDIMEKGGQEEGFIKTRMAHLELSRNPEDSREIKKKKLAEAQEVAFNTWYPIALALKHKLDINGSGKIKSNIDLEELTSKGDPTQDAIWVYQYLHFDDVCDYGNKPSYTKQPIAPSPTAYAIWCTYKYMDNGFKEFMTGFYLRYGPQKKDIELLQKNKDDGRHLNELNKDIANAKRNSEKLALQKSQN